jgi:hypothetical protein
MAHGIIGKNAKRALTRKLMERLWLQEGRGEEEEGLFKAKAMNKVDAGRDRATRGCRSVFWGGMDNRENGCSDLRQRIMSHRC